MRPKPSASASWARWLASQGLPRAHIARVLDCPGGDVAKALRRRVHGRTKHPDGHPLLPEMRRLRASGLTLKAISARLGMPFQAVHYYLYRRPVWRPVPPRPPRPLDADRPPVRSLTGTRFRRLLELGYEPARVAELLQVNPAAVADLVERLTRRQGPGPLRRARSHREQATLCDWDRFIPEADPEPLVSMAEAEPVKPAIAAAEPTPCQGWEDIQASEHHPRKLDAEAVRRFWLLRPKLSRRELAAEFGVSLATVGRIIAAGPPPAAEALGAELPATAAEPGPQRTLWQEPKGPRGDAYRDD